MSCSTAGDKTAAYQLRDGVEAWKQVQIITELCRRPLAGQMHHGPANTTGLEAGCTLHEGQDEPG